MMETYDWTELLVGCYEIISDTFEVYHINFTPADRYFDDCCSSCKAILEVEVVCLTKTLPPRDIKVGYTICKIIDTFLNNCNGVLYTCRDDDNKGEKREVLFANLYEKYDEEDRIDSAVSSYCDANCTKFTLLTEKSCTNYQQMVEDFHYRCINCSGYSSECE